MRERLWWEKWIGDYALYCGFFSIGDIRLGLSLGNREGSIDLLFFTMGYMK